MQVATPKKGYKMVKMSFSKYEEIPEEWEVEEINQISKIITSGVKKYSGQKEFIQTGDIKQNQIVSSSKYSYEKRPSRANMEVEIDDVLFAKMKETDKVLLISKKDSSFLFSTGFAVLRAEKQKILPQFLRHYVNSTNFQKLKDKFSEGGTQVAINQKEFSRLQILLPSIPEQKQIASILSNVDDTIQKTDQIIKQTQRLKKGMMQKLLTRGIEHTKFKKVKTWFGKKIEIPEEWEIKKIKDVSKLLVPLRDKPKEFVGNIPWLTLEDFDGKYVSESKRGNNVTLETVKKMNLTIFPVGTVLCSISATIGICSITTTKLITNQRFIGVVPTPKIDKEFLYYFLNTQKENILRVGTGSIHSYTSKYEFGKLSIVIPPLPEQKQIASILSNIDMQIQKEKLHKSNLERLKKGLMQKLLTGEVRVKL